MRPQLIEISRKTIIFTVFFLLFLVLLWQIRSIIILVFISFVFMEALNPAVTRLEKYKIPRVVSILLIYVLLLSFLSFIFAGIVPILIEQTSSLINNLPELLQNTRIFGLRPEEFTSQLQILQNLPGQIASLTLSIVSNIFSFIVILFITFYLLLERKNFSKYGEDFFGESGKEKFLLIVDRLEKRLGSWVNAELFLMAIIGVLYYIGYVVLGLKYAVPLSILAGLLEVVPTIGPIVAGIIAAAVGLTISPLTALLALAWGTLIQQIENNFIVPKVMNRTVGFNPLLTIILIAAGAELAGILGAILAVPVYLTIEVLIKTLSE